MTNHPISREDSERPASSGTSGLRRHVVRQGDCVFSIAATYGVPWHAVWDHAGNAALRASRTEPGILHPGDIVTIPAPAATQRLPVHPGGRHRFRGRVAQVRVQLTLHDGTAPRRGVRYEGAVEGTPFAGTTGADGTIALLAAATARTGWLRVYDAHGVEDEFDLQLGGLDPATEPTGMQQRLANLGLHTGDVSGDLDEATRNALSDFQRQRGLAVTDARDPAAATSVRDAHQK